MSCVRQSERPSEALYEVMVSCCSKAIVFACTSCRKHSSIVKRLIQHEYKSAHAEDEWLASTLKSIFARHGIPTELVTDDGRHFSSCEFKHFSSVYLFQHVTSSPRYPQSNGMMERAVGIVKRLLQNISDPHIALLSFRAIPLSWSSLSPAELLFGWKMNTDIPQSNAQLTLLRIAGPI